jgi:hypothetical protein
MGNFIDDKHPVVSCVLWIALLATIAFIFRELFYYGPVLLSALGHAVSLTATDIIKAFGLLGVEVGAATAGGLIAAAGVPVGVIVVYKFLVKTEEKRKAWLVAIGIFLYPIFVDFFRDELPPIWFGKGEGGASSGVRIAISIAFATLFTIATALHDKSNRWSKVFSVILYLMPAFIMIGYLVRYEHPTDVISFLSHLRVVEMIGLAGVILTALFGIYLSRTYSSET